jgi:orotate phosphoribosyltransferase
MDGMHQPLLDLLVAKHGHFKLESGYHTNLWLDLDPLFLKPDRLQPFIAELADRLSHYPIDAICGPLIGGAFLAQSIARELGKEFFYTERIVPQNHSALYSIRYELPKSLRAAIRGKRVAIVDDAISAGSAVRGTFTELKGHGAQPIAFGAMLILGNAIQPFCAEENIALESIENLPFDLWLPVDCPLCAANMPIEDAMQ